MKNYSISTKLDEQLFSQFAFFNKYIAFHRGIGFIFFILILITCAIVNFYTKSPVLGYIFLGIPLFTLLWNILVYPQLIKKQARTLHLDGEKIVYTITVSPQSITIDNTKQKVEYSYEQIYIAYRWKDCIYLYFLRNRCFILPANNINNNETADSLWDFLTSKLQKHQIKNLIKK